jgi:hypothetical protein
LREKEKKSDLIIQDISWTPQNPKQGDNVKFAVTIKNIGKGTAGKSHVFIVGINWGANKELFRIEDSCPSLKSGEAHTYYKNAKMENCGKYELMAFADAGGEVNESNENNNYRDASFEIPCEKPDLIIQDVSWTPQNPKLGDEVKFAVTVKNIGKETAGKSHVFIYTINWDAGKVLFKINDACPSLKPGEAYTYHKNVKMEDCGESDLMAWADARDEVTESNEKNNYKGASFTVPCTKEEGTLVVNVYSIDGKPAAEVKGTTTIELIKSGDVSPTAKQNINDKSRVTFNDIPIGNYYINVYHDPQLGQGSKEFWGQRKDISIIDGTTTTIDFYRYNPYVDKFYAEKNSVEVNTPVKINVGIKVPSNCPDADAYVKALVIIRDENGQEVYRDESDDRKVQKGGSSTFSFSYTPAKEGEYSGLAKAYIVGGGELCTDNCGWMKVFTCQKEEPDLTIQDITWKPKDPESEDPVDFTITVKNTGTKDVDSTIYVDFETGGTQQARKKVADSLKSGETATVTYNNILKKYCLSYLAQATVDPDNTIAESDENNNYKSETVNIVKKYALIVGINKYSKEEDLEGSVRAANKIRNLLVNGYKYDEVRLLTDAEASKKNILTNLTYFSNKEDSNDIFVFYFSGHGGRTEAGHEGIRIFDNALFDDELQTNFSAFDGTLICIFDCCKSGGMAYSTDIDEPAGSKNGINRDNTVVLMSCGVTEKGGETGWPTWYPEVVEPIYSHYLFEAFTSNWADADLNNDQRIALEEAHNYAWKKTVDYSKSILWTKEEFHPQIMDYYKSKSHPEAYCYFSRHPINSEFINE